MLAEIYYFPSRYSRTGVPFLEPSPLHRTRRRSIRESLNPEFAEPGNLRAGNSSHLDGERARRKNGIDAENATERTRECLSLAKYRARVTASPNSLQWNHETGLSTLFVATHIIVHRDFVAISSPNKMSFKEKKYTWKSRCTKLAIYK